MTGGFVVDVIGKLALDQQLSLLKMPLSKRARLLKKVSNKILRDSRKRVQTQMDLGGTPFKRRWKKRSDRRKMLSRLMRQAAVLKNDGTTAKIGWRGLAGFIAAKQQFGFSETMSAAKLPAAGSARRGPATKRQAATLIALGYKVKTRTGESIDGQVKTKSAVVRRPSLAWIMQNMTMGRAGAIIGSMREKAGIRPHTTWNTVIPARAFLGATDVEVMQYIQDIFSDMTQEMARGIR